MSESGTTRHGKWRAIPNPTMRGKLKVKLNNFIPSDSEFQEELNTLFLEEAQEELQNAYDRGDEKMVCDLGIEVLALRAELGDEQALEELDNLSKLLQSFRQAGCA